MSSISLTLNYNPPFKDLINKTKESYEVKKPFTMANLISVMEDKYGEKMRELVWDAKTEDGFHERLIIILNGNAYREENFLETQLSDGDKIWFAHTFFGG